MPTVYTDESPAPDDARRILAELPDGRYPLQDLIALDMRFYTAAIALFLEATADPPARRTVTFNWESGTTEITRPGAKVIPAVGHSTIRVELGEVSVKGN